MSNPSVFRLKLARTRQLLNNHTWTLYPHPCAVSRLCETKFWTPSNRRKKCTSLPFITIWLYSEVCTRRLYVQFATATPHGGRAVFAKVLASQRSNTKRSKWLVWPTLQCSSATKTNGNNSLSHSLSRRRLWCMAVKNHENEPMIKRWSGRGDGGGRGRGIAWCGNAFSLVSLPLRQRRKKMACGFSWRLGDFGSFFPFRGSGAIS